MSIRPIARLRIRYTLLLVILATLPCYCAGLVAVYVAPDPASLSTATPTPTRISTLAPQATFTQFTTFTPFPTWTASPTPEASDTPTPSLTPFQPPSANDTLTPTPTETEPVPDPSETDDPNLAGSPGALLGVVAAPGAPGFSLQAQPHLPAASHSIRPGGPAYQPSRAPAPGETGK